MSTAEIMAPELESKALSLTEQAAQIAVVDATSAQRAADFLGGVKSLAREIEDWFRPFVETAFKHHRSLVAAKNEKIQPLNDIEASIKRRISVWQTEDARRRREEEERLQRIARAEEEKRRLEEAAALEASGAHEEAEAIIEDAVANPETLAPQVTIAAPKIEGISTRETHKAVVEDLVALQRFVGANPSFSNLTIANQKALDQMARSLGMQMRIPGVKVVAESVIASRRG